MPNIDSYRTEDSGNYRTAYTADPKQTNIKSTDLQG